MVVKSIISRVKNKFNVSIGEIDDLDIHNSIVIGFAAVSNNTSHASSCIQNVLNFIDDNCEAVIINSYIEIL